MTSEEEIVTDSESVFKCHFILGTFALECLQWIHLDMVEELLCFLLDFDSV